jgi:short-subunit dehydrogenase
MKAKNKVLVVTGAGSGMGREIVLELLKREARVAAVDLNQKTLEENASLARADGSSLKTFVVDITDRGAVAGLAQAVVAHFGAVDGFINCAGIIQPFVRFADLDDQVIERVFAVNWGGTLHLTKAFLPLLLQRPEAHLVNFSSMGGFVPFPGQTAYGASKAAVKLLTEGLHSELADTRVRVTLVFPGAVATNIKANSGVGAGDEPAEQKNKAYPAGRAARDVLDAMERDRFRVLVGKDAKLLDVLYRLDPRRAAGFIARMMKHHLPPARPGQDAARGASPTGA